MENHKGLYINKIKTLHYIKLIYRSAVFIAALFLYFTRIGNTEFIKIAMFIVWLLFMAEMILKFFPSSIESRGCQKQFKKNYVPADTSYTPPYSGKGVLPSLVFWVMLNGIFVWLRCVNILDDGKMVLISLAYAVSDMICVLFFCPFQKWFLHNRCCVTCRIYNWDYAMICTPLLMVNNIFARLAVFAALLLLLRWEWTAYFHRERFHTQTNAAISCKGCTEKNCKDNRGKISV